MATKATNETPVNPIIMTSLMATKATNGQLTPLLTNVKSIIMTSLMCAM